jgi:hypothetical protein
MYPDAVPPELPTVFDLLRHPVTAEIRPAPLPPMFTITHCEGTPRRDEDDDPPRMLRQFSTSTSSEALVSRSYNDCARYATITGQPYAIDVRVWDAESGDIIERMNHTYTLRYRVRR